MARPDIQALRALAVAIVVAYHFWPHRMPGGYVGVDVFFVISGFLIIRGLIDEYDSHRRIDVPRFWARRARRLLPAALLVLAVTAVGVLTILPGSQQQQALKEIVASSLYVQNWVLAIDAVDYMAAENAPSPVQHFWSLSIEEQFYIVVPILLVIGYLLAKKRGLIAALAVVFVVSLGFSIWFTPIIPAQSYFVTPTRAWEFAAGGLIALAPGLSRLVAVRTATAWVGWAAIVVTAFVFDAQTEFPGIAAIVPVVATALVIWSNDPRGPWSPKILTNRATTRVGDFSYSIYLWHWPILIFATAALGSEFDWRLKLAVLVLTVTLAGLTWRFIENPVRYAFIRPPLPTFAAAGLAMALVVAPTALVWQVGRAAAAAELAASEARLAEMTACFGAEYRAPGNDCAGVVHEELTPDPTSAIDDYPEAYDDCIARTSEAELIRCEYGSPDGAHRVALVGDSHALSLAPTLIRLAEENGWTLVTYLKSACPHSTSYRSGSDQVVEQSCVEWNAALDAALPTEPPIDLLVVTHSLASDGQYGNEENAIAGYRGAWQMFTSRGAEVVVVRNVPRMADDTTICLELNESQPERCERPKGSALGERDLMIEAAEGSPAVHAVDLSDYICWDDTCKPAVGGVVVFRDTHHLTRTFAVTLAPALQRKLDEVGLGHLLTNSD